MTRSSRVRPRTHAPALLLLFALLVAPLVPPVPSLSGAVPESEAAASAAVAWLRTQQQADGSFETAGFPGFETRDVVLAVAEQAQTGAAWDATLARSTVEALKAGGSGPTPLDYLEGLVAASAEPGVAAKTVVLVSAPLGIPATAFGSVNLLTKMGGCGGTTSSTFNGLLYLVLAQQLVCGGTPAASLTAIRAAQQANGGWGFAGDPTTDDLDIDTTSLALQALIGGGASTDDSAVAAALRFLARQVQANGAWQFFGDDDPNSTAMAILAVTAAGFDVAVPCWRDTFAPERAGTAYTNPDMWLRSQQLSSGPDAGRVQSPSDSFGVNTLPTAQSVQALLRSWLPVARAEAQGCEPSSGGDPGTTSGVGAGGPGTSSGAGGVTAGDVVAAQPRFTG